MSTSFTTAKHFTGQEGGGFSKAVEGSKKPVENRGIHTNLFIEKSKRIVGDYLWTMTSDRVVSTASAPYKPPRDDAFSRL